MNPRRLRILVLAFLAATLSVAVAQDASPSHPVLQQRAALARSNADKEMMLGVARAGARIVAVGDHGVVLLSDDDGRSFRQAKSVPTRATLTGVAFADARRGWAVGHWGSIIRTEDGGETWTLQRTDTGTDRPLFAVLFDDAQHGIAVGLWSLMLTTADGGEHWTPVSLPAPPGGGKADRNLLGLFSARDGTWFVPAERGLVLRSTDHGANWSYLDTGYRGSFWCGVALADGTVLVAGLRGTIYRSEDRGNHWTAVTSAGKSSITAMTVISENVVAVGLDGALLVSRDGGRSFVSAQRKDRATLTAVAGAADGRVVALSDHGPVSTEVR